MSAYQPTLICYLNYHATVCDGVFLACLWGSMSSEHRRGTRQVHTYRFLPCRRVVGFQLVPGAVPVLSVGTRCGTRTISWYPVRYPDFGWYPGGTLNFGWHLRVSTLKSHAWPHIEGTRLYSYCLSLLTTQSPGAHSYPGQPRRVVSDKEFFAFCILDLCSSGQSN